ncbi:carboxyl-terminal protease-like protein [Marinobacter halophilus]|nr:carboxyl-terminal protease-like protein [Marinobacter halophilus]
MTDSNTLQQHSGLGRLSGISIIAATLWLSGCSVHQFNQSSIPAATPYQVTAPFHIDDSEAARWLMPEDNALRVEYVHLPAPMWYGYEESILANLPAILTLSLIPIHGTSTSTSSAAVVWQDQMLWRHQTSFSAKTWTSLFFPTPFLMPGGSGGDAALKNANAAAHKAHLMALADDTRAQDQRYAAINSNSPDALAKLLNSGDAPLLRPKATAQLIALAPQKNALEFHTRYADLPGYAGLLPDDLQAWLIGPDGLKGWQLKAALADGASEDDLTRKLILAHPDARQAAIQQYVDASQQANWSDNAEVARIMAEVYVNANHTPPFSSMKDIHRQSLINSGLPADLVKYMTDQPPSELMITVARGGSMKSANGKALTEEELIERLVRNDNSGQFMSPYTSDGVLAEWVNLANNANMGATAGSAAGAMAGAYAANKALDFVPFGLGGLVGGAIGSEIGKSGGREAAISASGGWAAIKAASDQSFDSLLNMARYLKQKYGTTANFMDAMRATTQIYPEFSSVLASTN